jgi:hypothetical protein
VQTPGRTRPAAIFVAVLVCAAVLGGCGGGGGANSLPNSLPGSLPDSLPSLPSTSRPSSSEPETTETTTETTTESATPPASATPASNAESDTPWGWIAAGVILLVLALVIAGWAFGRRGASRKTWSAQALEATGRGTGLHDAALAELIAATSANRPDRWSSIASIADELWASLQRLPAAPSDRATQTTQAALDAVGAAQSAIAIARGAPAGIPLDEEAARTLRERLEQLAAALGALRAYAERG